MLFCNKNKVISAYNTTGEASTTTTCDFVSLGLYNHFTAIVDISNCDSTATTIVLRKATSTTGAGEADGPFHYFYDTDSSATGTDLLTDGGDSTSAVTISSGDDQLYVIEGDSRDLGDYDCVTVQLSPSSGIQFNVDYVLSEPRYADAAPPTATSTSY